jgi:hypothetical protein
MEFPVGESKMTQDLTRLELAQASLSPTSHTLFLLIHQLANVDRMEPEQDAPVQHAVARLVREAQDSADAHAWERASRDPEFVAESRAIEAEFAADDREAFGV